MKLNFRPLEEGVDVHFLFAARERPVGRRLQVSTKSARLAAHGQSPMSAKKNVNVDFRSRCSRADLGVGTPLLFEAPLGGLGEVAGGSP